MGNVNLEKKLWTRGIFSISSNFINFSPLIKYVINIFKEYNLL